MVGLCRLGRAPQRFLYRSACRFAAECPLGPFEQLVIDLDRRSPDHAYVIALGYVHNDAGHRS